MKDIIRLAPSQVKQASRVLCHAFYQDPLVRYMLPDEAHRTQVLPSFYRIVVRYTCQRKIFAERLTPCVEPLARVTARLFQAVQALGLATGGMPGARLAQRLGIKTSWMTILRRIMALSQEPVQPVRELGRDDFAFHRGRTFGTILVDMISRQVIDILPDRQAETAAAWMAAHPEIELVSRDRGGDYAAVQMEAVLGPSPI
ncbi:MAG TPA: hypothetical protein VFV38_15095 [Ktedonobacteraceae bacterium]|nr:hypothetical protein [Ktedonobacteraceae bacterium]